MSLAPHRNVLWLLRGLDMNPPSKTASALHILSNDLILMFDVLPHSLLRNTYIPPPGILTV